MQSAQAPEFPNLPVNQQVEQNPIPPAQTHSNDEVDLESDLAASIHPEEMTDEPRQRSPGHILVVDDNKVNRTLLARYLAREQHQVSLAENGRQALEMVAGGQYDLVLLDLMMPEMNGFEVLQHLKASAEWRDIPVIIISALEEIDSVVACIEAGAEDYLNKPFNPVLLKARINASLDKKFFRDQEIAYLANVKKVTDAAITVEEGAFDPHSLASVAERPDALGRLGRVFMRMGQEVAAREQRLQHQVQLLKIELDEARQEKQVLEITETDYFQKLQAKAQSLRQKFSSDEG